MTTAAVAVRYASAELRKLPAFVERDFLTAISYRAAFVTDIVSLAGHIVVFYFVGRLVDPAKLPEYDGAHTTYLEYASIGIALGIFMHFALDRVATAIRNEQLMGTLESLLVTPTRAGTIQLGSVSFDLLYLPIRTGVFLGGIALAFGLGYHMNGVVPALILLVCFVPFVWGLGVTAAAAVITFRRGGGAIGFGGTLIGLASGVYFPVTLLPTWLVPIASHNPVALTIEGMRRALIGGERFAGVPEALAVVVPCGVASVAIGMVLFNAALRREQRSGAIGLY
jgi:ABC-2 type transport system permease protein